MMMKAFEIAFLKDVCPIKIKFDICLRHRFIINMVLLLFFLFLGGGVSLKAFQFICVCPIIIELEKYITWSSLDKI